MRPARKRSDIASVSADASVARVSANPVLRLQRKIGNRATGELLARAPATKDHGTVRVGKLAPIKIVGGNVGEWVAKKEPDTLDMVSKKGKHSAGLERLSNEGNKIPSVKVTTPVVNASGDLDFGSVEIELGRGRISGYSVDGSIETWRVVDFETAHLTAISHKTGV